MDIHKLLLPILPAQRIKTRLIDLVAYANDAGFYRLVPKAVVQPETIKEVQDLFAFSHTHTIPITFRTGGTSLSGQSISDGILVDLSQHWRKVTPSADGNTVRVQPGVIGAMVNAQLKKYNRKIGPDPSSIGSAMMGGILSNNSSGMCCGVQLNAYHTLKYLKFILPNGQYYDTENLADYQKFETEAKDVFDQINQLKAKIESSKELSERIRAKYKTKNTVGYSLNSFLDYSHPLDILAHLLVGGEGTLAFIAEAVLDTVWNYPYKSTAFLYFPDIYQACNAIVPLKESGAEALELMDRASLQSIENTIGAPDILKNLPASAAALLVEYQDDTLDNLQAKVLNATAITQTLSLLQLPIFTTDPKEQYNYWKMRKGMFPSVGAMRAQGTTVILEDITFPIHRLADAVGDCQLLFQKYKYDNAIIFGHAKDGNIHFVVTQTFNNPKEIERYESFMNEIVALVVNKYDGSLKAEHGTGRNMAPFVETEWGGEAYVIMQKLKNALDPLHLLNPGVIINHDKKAHIKNLKKMPVVEAEVDKCIECGACEPKCPSRDLTLTPRRRIVVRRELALLKENFQHEAYKNILADYQYDGLDTCAVDGLCAVDCPVNINTGDLVKRLRKENHSNLANITALFIAKNFKLTEQIIKLALHSGALINSLLGKNTMSNLTQSFKKLIPSFPLWTNQLGAPPKINFTKLNAENKSSHSIVYFTTCISRTMGNAGAGKAGLAETFVSVAKKANIEIIIPTNLGYCCGQAFGSKGFYDAYTHTANKTIAAMWQWSNQGTMPVVLDVSSCTYTLHNCRNVLTDENKVFFDKITIIDTIDFLYDFVLPLNLNRKPKDNVVVHPVCSLTKMGLNEKFVAVAKHYALDVTVPTSAGCCGMAGDRGFLFPELTQSATQCEAAEVNLNTYDGYYSTAKTCEMSMSAAVGKDYENVLYMADECMV